MGLNDSRIMLNINKLFVLVRDVTSSLPVHSLCCLLLMATVVYQITALKNLKHTTVCLRQSVITFVFRQR